MSGDIVAHWRPSPSLRSGFLRLPCPRRCSRSGRERKGSMRHPRRLSLSRLSHLPERWIAVIVRHRIVKPRLDDELAALEDARHRHQFLHRRPRAWRDANAMIANLIHPQANMSQDALDDLRVVDERHGAHLVLKLGCHGCHRDTAADQLPRPS